MSLNMIMTLNLEKLEGTARMSHKGEEGIFIPARPNKLFMGDKGVFTKLYMLQKEDKFGNPYMVARSLTLPERKRRKALKWLGNANYENKVRRYRKPDEDDYEPYENEDKFI